MMKQDRTNEISTMELAKLDANNLAYIRPVQIENTVQFTLFAGDGQELSTASTLQSAYLAALENNLNRSAACTDRLGAGTRPYAAASAGVSINNA